MMIMRVCEIDEDFQVVDCSSENLKQVHNDNLKQKQIY